MTAPVVRSASQRNQHDIVTVFGLYSRLNNEPLPISNVIALLAPLGVEDASVRSSVSRLKRRDVLVSTRFNGSAAYRLSPQLEDVFREGDARIFSPRRATAADPWLLVSFSVPESERHLRHQMRSILVRLGCGQISSGLWIATEQISAELEGALKRADLRSYVEFFQAVHLPRADTAPAIRKWWDLDMLEHLYSDFIERYEPMLRQDDHERTDGDQFADQIRLLTEWRRLPYLDPGIPLAYLPSEWSAQVAERLFLDLFARLAPAAERFARSVTGASGPRTRVPEER